MRSRPRCSRSTIAWSSALLLAALPGCQPASELGLAAPSSKGPRPAASKRPESRVQESKLGPVSVTLRLSPKEPRLGDAIFLTLEATTCAGVELCMPDFGDALGRFDVISFAPSDDELPDGGQRVTQRYELAPPMSGLQSIPSLLVEFFDRRPGQDPSKPRELLTEPVTFEVASLLPEGQLGSAMAAPRPALPPLPKPTVAERSWPWLLLALALGAALLTARSWRHWRRQRLRVTAYDRALARLEQLAAGGWPQGLELDGWYVELSHLIRSYLEQRFGLRAPELTTEEFIRVAGRSDALAEAQRAQLRDFLKRCDQVKFAGYEPGAGESEELLASARRFLSETRVKRTEATTKPKGGPAHASV